MRKFYKVTLFFVFYSIAAAGQQQMGPFMAYGPEARFLSSQNYTVYQSKKGYLWIGNQNGIVRFDGKKYQHFVADYTEPNSPSDNMVVDIVEDKNGYIWFCGFSNGLTKFDEQTGNFTKYRKPTKDNFQYYGINGGLKDAAGNLWFATSGRGIAQYLYEQDSFAVFYPEPELCKDGSIRGDNYATSICEDKSDQDILWVTSYQGLYSFSKKNKRFIHYPTGKKNTFYKDVTFNSCAYDRQGNLWLGSWGEGIMCFNTVQKKYVPQLTHRFPSIVSHVKLVNDSLLFAACLNDGLYQLNINKATYSAITPSSIPGALSVNRPAISRISITPDAGIFIGGNNYIYQLHPAYTRLQKNITYQDKAECELRSLVWDSARKQYWIATAFGNGLYALKENTTVAEPLAVKDYPKDKNRIFSNLIKDKLERIWVLNYSNGLNIFNNEKKRFESPAASEIRLPDSLLRAIKSLETDQLGNIWMFGNDQFIYYDVKTGNHRFYPVNWGDDFTGASKSYYPALLKIDPDGNPWLLTQNGFFTYNTKTGKVTHIYKTGETDGSLPSMVIDAGSFNMYNSFWISCANNLYVYDWKKHQVLSNHDINSGLPSSSVKDIKSDAAGHIWVTTPAGLGHFDPQKKMWLSYTRVDGFESDFLDGSLFITDNNKIAIDQKTGFVLTDLRNMSASADTPLLRFTSISINDDKQIKNDLSALTAKGLVLPYDQNNITVEFAAMDWLYPFKTGYLYKITGIQSKKTFTPFEQTKLNLAGLAPGSYEIHVKAISSSGIWSNEIVLPITIKKPYWQTAWFISLCSLLAFLLLYAFYRYRIHQLKKMHTIRNNIAKDLHDEIGSTLTSIRILSEVSEKNLNKDHHKAAAFLQKIKEQSAAVQQGISDIVWAVNPENDRLENIVIHMREYAAHTLDLKNIHTQLDIDEKALGKTLNMGQRRDFFLLFREAINNIAKYAQATEVHIKLEKNGSDLCLSVADNGIGFDTSRPTSSIGIKNMQLRARALKGECSIVSVPGQGTRITVIFPAT